MTKRSTAIYFAREAYKTWMYNGRKVEGFDHTDLIVGTYCFKKDGWEIYMRSNGAVVTTKQTATA